MRKGKKANFPDHGIFESTNESNRDVERGFYNKRSAEDPITLPPVINRLETGSLLRVAYVNQPTEELRHQVFVEIS